MKEINQVCFTGAFLSQVKGEVNTPGAGKSNGSSTASEGSGHVAFASLLHNILGGTGAVFMDPAPSMGGTEGIQGETHPPTEEAELMDQEEEALGDIPQDVYRLLFPGGDLPRMSCSEVPEGSGEALVPIQEGLDHRQTTKESLPLVSLGTLRVERETMETGSVREFQLREGEPAADTVDVLQKPGREEGLGTKVNVAKAPGLEAGEGFIRHDHGISGDFSVAEMDEQGMDRFNLESISKEAVRLQADGVPEGSHGKPDKMAQGNGNHPLPFFLRDVREEIQSIRSTGEGRKDVPLNREEGRDREAIPVTQMPLTGPNGAVWESIQEEPLVSRSNALSESIIEQVTAGVKVSNRDKGSELELQLKPEGLGRLTIKLSLQEGEMVARIVTDNLQVQEILHQEAHTLRNILRNEHIDFTQLEVVYQQAEPGMEMSHHGGAPYREGHGDSPSPQDVGRIREGNPGDGSISEKASAAGLLNYLV